MTLEPPATTKHYGGKMTAISGGAPNRLPRGAKVHPISESRPLATEEHASSQPGLTAIGAIHRSTAAVCHARVSFEAERSRARNRRNAGHSSVFVSVHAPLPT
jgi:hypothetical protein